MVNPMAFVSNRWLTLAVFLFSLFASIAAGEIDRKNTTPQTIRITDKNGQPIPNAKVWVSQWGDKAGKNHYVALASDPPTTNEKGELEIDAPSGAISVRISAEAKGFSKNDGVFSLSGVPELALEHGTVIRLRAINEDGAPAPDAFVLLQDCRMMGSQEFKKVPEQPGYFVSPTVSPDRRWLRVFRLSDEGTMISPLIDTQKPADVAPDGTIIAKLAPGIRLEGKLDESVPRPIKAGVVELCISERENHQIGRGWKWEETATVKPDGTFVFESLPPGGHAQMVAFVEGYQSSRPTVDELKAYLAKHGLEDDDLTKTMVKRHDAFWPHLLPLPKGQAKVSVTLPCQPTGAVDLKIIDAAGTPIAGAVVKVNPNGYFLGGESFIPGTQFSTKSHADPGWYPKWAKSKNREWAENIFTFTTDENGLARVRNLPNDDRISLKVKATGYVMPIHPARPLSRHFTVQTVVGKTLQRTLTMEPITERSEREIVVVDHNGNPAQKVQVSIKELTTVDTPDIWQFWSVARFGEIASQMTNSEGIVRLKVPTKIDGLSVAQLRLIVNGHPTRGTYVRNRELVIPRKEDDRIVSLSLTDEVSRRGQDQLLAANYVDPNTGTPQDPRVLLGKIIKTPSLSALRQLLTQQGFDAATPLSFSPDRNVFDDYRNKQPVEVVETEFGQRVAVLCKVRPKDASWKTKPKGRFPPEAAFVFHPDGQLVKMIGGSQSSRGSYSSISLYNYGGTDDALVRTSYFEPHGPHEMVISFFHLGQPEKPLLTLHGLANSIGWSGTKKTANPPAEAGWICFRFNSQDIPESICGITPLGREVPRFIYWDGVNNQFIGPEEQSVDSKPLYRVDTENSHAYQPVEVLLGQPVVAGGRVCYRSEGTGDHDWQIAIPKGSSGVLKLLTVYDGKEEELTNHKIGAGCSNVFLSIKDADGDKSKIDLKLPNKSKKGIVVPRIGSFAEPSVADQRIYRAFDTENVLMDRATKKQGTRVVLKLQVEEPEL